VSHHLYKTKGFVLGGINAGEANRYISLFTKDIGLVRAVAKSVREERSKLRYSLQDFSYSDISLVRGRDVWRVTGAAEHYNIHRVLEGQKEKQAVVVRLFSLLRRLLHGEEKNDHLFSTLVAGHTFLQNTELDANALENFECIVVLRILYALGYVGEQEQFEELMNAPELSGDMLTKIAPMRRAAVSEINRALKESQL